MAHRPETKSGKQCADEATPVDNNSLYCFNFLTQRGIDLLVELVDDVDRRGPRCADAEPTARLVASEN